MEEKKINLEEEPKDLTFVKIEGEVEATDIIFGEVDKEELYVPVHRNNDAKLPGYFLSNGTLFGEIPRLFYTPEAAKEAVEKAYEQYPEERVEYEVMKVSDYNAILDAAEKKKEEENG